MSWRGAARSLRCGTAAVPAAGRGSAGSWDAAALLGAGSRALHVFGGAPQAGRRGRCRFGIGPAPAGAVGGWRGAASAPAVEAPALEFIRNVAIIAHVDHGKTTLVDQLLRQSGMGIKVTERMLDSKDLEQERGITILSKATRVAWNGYVFNIVDTPGHADFGGEVERVLSMVDGVVLLVDAVEGPKTQTKFVLQKALTHPKMKPMVVINKVDRPMAREPGEVENDIFDIFATMATSDEQLEYPTLYASGKVGFCARSLAEARSEGRPTTMLALFETIRDCVPPPKPAVVDPEVVAADEKCHGFSMLVSQLDRLPALGPTVTGKVFSGHIQKGERLIVKSLTGETLGTGRVKEITVVQGVTREPIKRAMAGDIVSISVTGFLPRWTQTLVSHAKVPSIPCTPIDPPVISVRCSVNDSPLAGKDGKYITMHSIGERLEKEAITNPAIEIHEAPQRNYFEIRGRGEMQIGILIEEMRREGYEMSLSPPSVVRTRGEDGVMLEPWEDVQIEVGNEYSSVAIERMAVRGAKVLDVVTVPGDRQSMKFEVATSAFLGVRSWLRDATGGTAAVVSEFKEMRPVGPTPPRERNGVLISNTLGTATPVDLSKAAKLGTLFIREHAEVYPGMIFGENSDITDIDTNICKKHDGYRSAGNYAPPQEKQLEQALTYIQEDEKVEVTPKRIVMRKAILDAVDRKNAEKRRSITERQ